ncbi:MAG: FixH family protein [Halioglobus sp.]
MTPSPLQPADDQPWYQQFWPWFLIALPGSVVVAGFITLYIANKHSDDLVVDEYYKNGLAINRQIAKQQRAADMGLSATLIVDASTITVRTTGPITSPVLNLRLSHPLESDADFELPLSRVASGEYRATLQYAVAPNWHWILESGRRSAWRLDGSLVASDFPELSAADDLPDQW